MEVHAINNEEKRMEDAGFDTYKIHDALRDQHKLEHFICAWGITFALGLAHVSPEESDNSLEVLVYQLMKHGGIELIKTLKEHCDAYNCDESEEG